jgi:hypothetical protein
VIKVMYHLSVLLACDQGDVSLERAACVLNIDMIDAIDDGKHSLCAPAILLNSTSVCV